MDGGDNDKYDKSNNIKQRNLLILNRVKTCDIQKLKTPRN